MPGVFGGRDFEGKIASIPYARKHKIPFLGICYGMQAAVVEFARSELGLADVTTTEYEPNANNPVISLMEEQKRTNGKGGTMRLDAFECRLKEGTNSHRAYGPDTADGHHRHRFELNNYRDRLKRSTCLTFPATYETTTYAVDQVPKAGIHAAISPLFRISNDRIESFHSHFYTHTIIVA